MSLIQTPWTSQPPIGTQASAAKAKDLGVIYLAVANEAGQLRDVIGGGTLTNPGGSSIGQGGRIWTFNGAQQANKAFALPNGETNPNNFLICAKIRATATQTGSPGAAFGIYISSEQSGCGVGFNSSNQVGTAWLSNAGAGIQAYSTASLNTWYTVYSNTQVGGGYYSWINGVPATTGQGGAVSNFISGLNEISVGAQHRQSGFLRNFTGDIEWVAIVYRPSAQITDDFSARLYRDGFPYNVFQPLPRRIFVPVAAGGNVTITGNIGNATAAGLTATVSQAASIAAGVGNSVAAGSQASIAQQYTLSAGIGNATAAGLTATITASGLTTISCTTGNAAAAGSTATVNSSATVTCSVGNASAAGLTAALDTAFTILANVGNATADGLSATIQAATGISCGVANAIAAGLTASITNNAPLTDSQKIDLILDILSNRQTLDPVTGVYTLYADDGTTVLKTAQAWEDAAGTIPYRGRALQRLDGMA